MGVEIFDIINLHNIMEVSYKQSDNLLLQRI